MIMAKPKKAALDISYSSEVISGASEIMNQYREELPGGSKRGVYRQVSKKAGIISIAH